MKPILEVPTRTSPRRERRLFAAGALPREHRPCYAGNHRGPFLRRPDQDAWIADAFGEMGFSPEEIAAVPPQFDCLCCGSTIGRAQAPRAS